MKWNPTKQRWVSEPIHSISFQSNQWNIWFDERNEWDWAQWGPQQPQSKRPTINSLFFVEEKKRLICLACLAGLLPHQSLHFIHSSINKLKKFSLFWWNWNEIEDWLVNWLMSELNGIKWNEHGNGMEFDGINERKAGLARSGLVGRSHHQSFLSLSIKSKKFDLLKREKLMNWRAPLGGLRPITLHEIHLIGFVHSHSQFHQMFSLRQLVVNIEKIGYFNSTW